MPFFSTAKAKNNRLHSIDLLRGIAVLLVILRHWNTAPFFSAIGWMGVDLFFVISGFLISGLLFSELEKHGKIDFMRFFIRRGLKIYPLFFLLVAGTFAFQYYNNRGISFLPYLYELLFVQNYLGGVYLHTWSLAVEEHFYVLLLLCFGLFFIARKERVVGVCLFFIIAPLLLRISGCLFDNCNNHFYTHTRVDSLFMGVLLCYGWKYHKEKLIAFRKNGGYTLLIACLVFLGCFGFMMPESFFTQTLGFTIIALCFACILLFSLGADIKNKTLIRPLSFIGFYSYSVYLAHIPVKWALEYYGIEESEENINLAYFGLYTFASVATGLLFSELIELPLLRVRDKLLPSKA